MPTYAALTVGSLSISYSEPLWIGASLHLRVPEDAVKSTHPHIPS
jgi:hypothetical protein